MGEPEAIRGRTFDTQRFSLHDGRGIRTTVFLKGCPLSCLWCHNPESQSFEPERVFRVSRCMGCGACAAACVRGALTMADGEPVVDRAACATDGACAAACPTVATEILGVEVGVEDVLAELRRDVAVFDESGGGVTFSGGEPLAQPVFLEALLWACRDGGIHTTVETCGYATPQLMNRIGELADAFLFDVKHVDDPAHRALTGVSNRRILENLGRLTELRRRLGRPEITVRVPLVAGLNDDDPAVQRLAMLLSSLDPPPPVELLPYRPFGESKYTRLGRPVPLPEAQAPSRARLGVIAEMLQAAGLPVSLTGYGHVDD